MSFTTLIRDWLGWFKMLFRRKSKGAGISLLVPFRADSNSRKEDWDWLSRYWRAHLPAAKLIIADDGVFPFGKSASVNIAAKRAKKSSDIYVILDADCYLDYKIILDCAKQIRHAARKHRKLWFIPYRRFYRLTKSATFNVLHSDPKNPITFSDPPPPNDIGPSEGSAFGHWYGALIQIMPKEAFIAAGGMDENFRGWGGEDVSFMHAVDTLWAKHKTTDNQVLHLWHQKIGEKWAERKWVEQEESGSNNPLSWKYSDRLGDKARMRKLVDEG